jgi:hypothetical protein
MESAAERLGAIERRRRTTLIVLKGILTAEVMESVECYRALSNDEHRSDFKRRKLPNETIVGTTVDNARTEGFHAMSSGMKRSE